AEEPAPAVESPAAVAAQAVISDLHWLIHQGHVIEFANGILETAKKPAPRPPRPEKQPRSGQTAEQQGEGEVTTQEGISGSEGGAATEAGASAEEAAGESINEQPVAEAPAEATTVQDESGVTAGADVPGGEQFPVSDTSP